jgi:hypothetical protein
MAANKEKGKETGKGILNTPSIVSPQEWDAARQKLLVKEKAFTRSRDALAAERQQMPWLPPDPAVQVVELARQLRRRGLAQPEVGRGVRRR